MFGLWVEGPPEDEVFVFSSSGVSKSAGCIGFELSDCAKESPKSIFFPWLSLCEKLPDASSFVWERPLSDSISLSTLISSDDSESDRVRDLDDAEPLLLDAAERLPLDAEPLLLDTDPLLLDAEPLLPDTEPLLLDTDPLRLEAEPLLLEAEPLLLDSDLL